MLKEGDENLFLFTISVGELLYGSGRA